MLYNNPPAYRVSIGFETLDALSDLPNVVAIKEARRTPAASPISSIATATGSA